jgi:hypothetical protein
LTTCPDGYLKYIANCITSLNPPKNRIAAS